MYPWYSVMWAGTNGRNTDRSTRQSAGQGNGLHPPPPTQQPSRVNAQRTPDWTPVTTAAETHVPASPSCGVATWATSYQAPKTAKLPLWGGPPAARRWSGSQNASCFFGRTLRNVHFGNARSTPSDAPFAIFAHSAPPITILAINPVDHWGDMHLLTHCLHMLHYSVRPQFDAQVVA